MSTGAFTITATTTITMTITITATTTQQVTPPWLPTLDPPPLPYNAGCLPLVQTLRPLPFLCLFLSLSSSARAVLCGLVGLSLCACLRACFVCACTVPYC